MEEYIIAAQGDSKWFVLGTGICDKDCPYEVKHIHKKHATILDAYLLDNGVEIELIAHDTKDWIKDYDFIVNYEEDDEYRLKEKTIFQTAHKTMNTSRSEQQSFKEQLVKEVIGDGVETIGTWSMNKRYCYRDECVFNGSVYRWAGDEETNTLINPEKENLELEKERFPDWVLIREHGGEELVPSDSHETIKAPNSDVEFLEPPFLIKLFEEFKKEIFARVKHTNNGCFIPITYDLDGKAYDHEGKDLPQYNLTPYQKPKPWYEIESNFGKLIYFVNVEELAFFISYKDGLVTALVHGFEKESVHSVDAFRPATNGELDQLMIN